jgi:hypothetical protein
MPALPSEGRLAVSGLASDHRHAGDALLSNTTVCEASRLLLESSGTPSDALRVLDLMGLIDAMVLHEQLCYLPSSLPTDIEQLAFRNNLIENNALVSLPRNNDSHAVGEALLASLGTVDDLKAVAGTPLVFEDLKPQLADELGLNSAPGDETYDLERYTVSRVAAQAKSFDAAVKDLIGWLDYAVSGAYQDSVGSLRAFYYVFASEHYGLPYLASAGVQKVQKSFPNYFGPSVREKLYELLSEALHTTVKTVAAEFNGSIVFVPPFSALVFHRAATPADIPSEALALRDEYHKFRKKMCELEKERLEAKSLNDRQKFLNRIERLGKEVTRPFEQPSQVRLEPALRYIPDVVKVATEPTNPEGWAKILVGMPTEALLGWYRRRPVSKLVRAGREVGGLPGYDQLLAKHFGEKLASSALDIQSALQTS